MKRLDEGSQTARGLKEGDKRKRNEYDWRFLPQNILLAALWLQELQRRWSPRASLINLRRDSGKEESMQCFFSPLRSFSP